MKYALNELLAVTLLFALAAQAQELPRGILTLANVRRQAKLDLARVPSFTCLETIDRLSRKAASSEWRVRDALRVEVAHAGAKELYAWPGAPDFEERPLAELVDVGMVSTGEFTSFARDALIGSSAVLRYVGAEELRGRRMARFDYEIGAAFSGLIVGNGRTRAQVAQRGSIWADEATFELALLAVNAVEIPESLGLELVGTEIEYQRVKIGPDDYLLPQRATSRMKYTGGEEFRNEIEFTHCRQFGAQSVVSFSDDAPGSSGAAVTAARKPEEARIPAGLVIPVRLDTPLLSASAKIGDAVEALVESDVQRKGTVVVPAGARLTGRLRLMQRESGRFTVGLEFTGLAFGNKHARFLADLAKIDPRFARLVFESPATVGGQSMDGAGTSYKATRIEKSVSLPGVGTFFVPGAAFELPQGMRMEWVTVELHRAR